MCLTFLVVLSIVGPAAPGPGEHLKFTHIGAKEGLPQSGIYWIFQDSKGFMWFCTGNGVTRYDGYRFTVFKHKPDDPGSPGHRIVIMASEDQRGNLWFGTYNSLDRFDRESETFIHYRYRVKGGKEGTSGPVAWILPSTNESGQLLLSTYNGLERFDTVSGTFTVDPVMAEFIKQVPGRIPQELQEDENGNIWFLFNDTLHKYHRKNKRITPFGFQPDNPRSRPRSRPRSHPGNQPESPRGDGAQFIYKWKKQPDVLWLGTTRGLARFDIKDEVFRHYNHDPANPQSLSHPILRAICQSPVEPDILWLVALDPGGSGALNKFDTGTGRVKRYQHDPTNPDSLNSSHLSDVYQDKSGVLWVGTYTTGLNKASPGRFRHYYHNPNRADGLNNNIVRAIYEPPTTPGTVWLGTETGVNRFDRFSGEFQAFPLTTEETNLSVRVLYQCPSLPGTLWIGTHGSGLFRYHTGKQTIQRYISRRDDPGTIPTNSILALHESKAQQGYLWISFGGMNRGLTRMDYKNHTIENFELKGDTPGPVIQVLTFHESPSAPGILWMGAQYAGLLRFDTKNGEVTPIMQPEGNLNRIARNTIPAIHQSPRAPDVLWLGTAGGLVKYYISAGSISTNGIPPFMKDYYIRSILEDNWGNLWMGTDNGLIKFSPFATGKTGFQFRRYDLWHGLQGNNFLTAAWRSSVGEIYLGGTNGFNLFHPGFLKDNPGVPPVVITGFKLFNREAGIGVSGQDGRPVLTKHISETGTITLSHRDNIFSFSFAALDYDIPEKNRYAYKMEGLDKHWHYIGNTRNAAFTGLPPGSYTFRVMGSNSDGKWNKAGASVKVTILPPWWRTGWAYFLYLLLLAAVVMAAYRWQRDRLLGKERRRTEMEEARLRTQAAEAQARAMEAENQRKTHELDEARRLQLSMLPQSVPKIPGLDIAAFMSTATEVGGDYYDFYQHTDGSLTFAIGDATGHGLKAGTMVSIAKTIFLSEIPAPGGDLRRIFQHGNRTLKEMALGNLFMGLTLLHLDVRKGKAFIASAGMPPVYIYRGDSEEVREISLKAPPLGAFKDFQPVVREIRLAKGDMVLLFSDGLPELFSPEEDMFGYGSLKQLFGKVGSLPPDAVIDYLVEAGGNWLEDKPQDDDITFVAIKVEKA